MRDKLIFAVDLPMLMTSLSDITISNAKIVVLCSLENFNVERSHEDIFLQIYNSLIAFIGAGHISQQIGIVESYLNSMSEETSSPLWFEKVLNLPEYDIYEILSKAKYNTVYLPSGLLDPLSIMITRNILNKYYDPLIKLNEKRIVIYAERPHLDYYLLRWDFGTKGARNGNDILKRLYDLWKSAYNKFGKVKYFKWGGGMDLDYSLFYYGEDLKTCPLPLATRQKEVLESFRKEVIHIFQ